MADNNNSKAKIIFSCILFTFIISAIFIYLPTIKANLPVMPEYSGSTSNLQDEDSTILSMYKIRDSEINVNSYSGKVVFSTTGTYTVWALKDDMGYILISVEEDGIPPKVHYFVGKGWFNITSSSIIPSESPQ